jgi:5-formyltetrahydrofolate cyclo-ligase
MEAVKPADNRYKTNRLNIKEPDPEYGIRVDKKDIDVIIVPLLGFDEKRNRLGHGGGYYDRFMKDCKALKIGVAYSVQKVDQIMTDDNDVALDMIITEKEVL